MWLTSGTILLAAGAGSLVEAQQNITAAVSKPFINTHVNLTIATDAIPKLPESIELLYLY